MLGLYTHIYCRPATCLKSALLSPTSSNSPLFGKVRPFRHDKYPVSASTPRYTSYSTVYHFSNAFCTQEWTNLTRDYVLRLRTPPPLVFFGGRGCFPGRYIVSETSAHSHLKRGLQQPTSFQSAGIRTFLAAIQYI